MCFKQSNEPVYVVTKKQKKGLVVHMVLGGINGVAKAVLFFLHNKHNALTNAADMLCIRHGSWRQLTQVRFAANKKKAGG